jgi:hypothetical protein
MNIAAIIGAIVKAILEALLGKPVKRETEYRDAKGNSETDGVFRDSDW